MPVIECSLIVWDIEAVRARAILLNPVMGAREEEGLQGVHRQLRRNKHQTTKEGCKNSNVWKKKRGYMVCTGDYVATNTRRWARRRRGVTWCAQATRWARLKKKGRWARPKKKRGDGRAEKKRRGEMGASRQQ
jgi:hypothetical protein